MSVGYGTDRAGGAGVSEQDGQPMPIANAAPLMFSPATSATATTAATAAAEPPVPFTWPWPAALWRTH